MKKQIQKLKIKHVKVAFILLIVLTLILIYFYYNIILKKFVCKNKFVDQMVEISDQNENDIFSIEKIQLHSSANAIDNSKDHSLSNLNISQYTDISIYINNSGSSNDLTDENTIKKLYIDNINITPKTNVGTQYLNYKNANLFGKYHELTSHNDKIDFKILNTNKENENNNYDEPVFYTDCSNPITLGYLNKNILTNYSINDNNKTISFNGKVLEETNINLDNISSVLNFTIHIVNNLNQSFSYNMKLDIKLNDNSNSIFNGSYDYSQNTTGNEYKFMSGFSN